MIEYIQQAMSVIPSILIGACVFQSVRAKDKQDKIIYLLWVIVFLMVAIADKLVL